jgi:hypothetical protein
LCDEITECPFEGDENPVEVSSAATVDMNESNPVEVPSADNSAVNDAVTAENVCSVSIATETDPSDVETGIPANPVTTLEANPIVVEECETGYLMIRSPPLLPSCRSYRQVPNCCAVCLCPYEVGETVVWSSNPLCQHAFHQDCMLDWLTKMQDGTPCPCCRQDFTDLATHNSVEQTRSRWDWFRHPNASVVR